MQQQLRLSLHASDMLIPTTNTITQNQPPQQDTSGWIVQTTEDGSEQYYYNTRTQEMRYSIPPEIYMDEKVKQALASTNGRDESSMNEIQEHFERPPVRPVRAANRIISEDHTYSRAISTVPPPLKDEFEMEFEDDERVCILINYVCIYFLILDMSSYLQIGFVK